MTHADIALLIFAAAMFLAGYNMGRAHGYRKGHADAVYSSTGSQAE
jgi:hypothetical protein